MARTEPHPIDSGGWAVVPTDPLAHLFQPGAAYPRCRSWFDWGSTRHQLPTTTPCPACVAALDDLRALLVEALASTWWVHEKSEIEGRLADVEGHITAARGPLKDRSVSRTSV